MLLQTTSSAASPSGGRAEEAGAVLGREGLTVRLKPPKVNASTEPKVVASAALPRAVAVLEHKENSAQRSVRSAAHSAEVSLSETSYRQAMANYGDVQYSTHITVGNQRLAGILDTGSFELVVFSRKCFTCGRAGKYDPEASSTYKKGILTSGQSYGSGSCFSRDAWETVSIGQFQIPNQSFWEVSEAKMPILFNAAFQCVVGLGPPETPASDAWKSASAAIHNVSDLLHKGYVPSNALTTRASTKSTIALQMLGRRTMLDTFNSKSFSVCLGKHPGSEGFFVWNDTIHVVKPQSFVRVPVVGKHTWTVQMSDARLTFPSPRVLRTGLAKPPQDTTWQVRHKPLRSITVPDRWRELNTSKDKVFLGCENGCSALMDSGTSLLSVPAPIIDKLMLAVQKVHANCSNLADLPHLEFNLGGHTFSLSPDAYIVEVSSTVPNYLQGFVRVRNLHGQDFDTTHCELAVMETQATAQFGPLWILGMPFFRSYYTTFSVGETKSDRALFMSQASKDCYPTDRRVAASKPVELYRRRVDLSKVWIPQTVAMAASNVDMVQV